MHPPRVAPPTNEIAPPLCEPITQGSHAENSLAGDSTIRQLKNEVQMRDQFISIATHELKTPLTCLHSLLQLLHQKSQSWGPDSRQELLQMIEKAQAQSTRMVKLTEDLLDLSRIHSGQLPIRPALTDLVEIVRETIERMDSELKANGCEVTLTAPDRLQGRWDRARLEEVALNLLSNAIKYGRGRPISVRILERKGSDGAPRAQVSIADHGSGIAQEDQGRIFAPFERAETAEDQPGHGLGLYIVRQILKAHGGTVGVKSKLGQGAEFHFELPCEPRGPNN
jgi:signal transduction histidine kinase